MNTKKISLSLIVLLLISFSAGFFNTAQAAWIENSTINNDTGKVTSAYIDNGDNVSITVSLDVGALDSSGANTSFAYVDLRGAGYDELNVFIYDDGVQVNIVTNYEGGSMNLEPFLDAVINETNVVVLQFTYGGDVNLYVEGIFSDSAYIASNMNAYTNLVYAVIGCTSGTAEFWISDDLTLDVALTPVYTISIIVQDLEATANFNGSLISDTVIPNIGRVYNVEFNASDIIGILATPTAAYDFANFTVSAAIHYGVYLGNPTYLQIESDATITIKCQLKAPAPTPFNVDFGEMVFTFTTLIYLIVGAIITFLGLLILLRASGSWVIGLILLLAGFFMNLLSMPNIFGLVGFCLEAIIASVFLYRGVGKPEAK